MKKFFLFLALILCFAAWGAQEQGKIVEIIKNTPVFEFPQRGAKILADADVGSHFTVLRLSPKKTWIQLVDEDGNKGWVPAQRTNYFIIEAPVANSNNSAQKQDSATAQNVDEEKKKSPKEISEGKAKDPFRDSKVFLIPSFRKGFTEPQGPWGFGGKIFVNARLDSSHKSTSKVGLEAGYYQMRGQKKNEAKGFSIPLRYKMLNRDLGSEWITGFDLGVLFLKIRPSDRASFWKTNISAGYSFGWTPQGSSLAFWLRPGVEFLFQSRFSIEGNAAWVF